MEPEVSSGGRTRLPLLLGVLALSAAAFGLVLFPSRGAPTPHVDPPPPIRRLASGSPGAGDHERWRLPGLGDVGSPALVLTLKNGATEASIEGRHCEVVACRREGRVVYVRVRCIRDPYSLHVTSWTLTDFELRLDEGVGELVNEQHYQSADADGR